MSSDADNQRLIAAIAKAQDATLVEGARAAIYLGPGQIEHYQWSTASTVEHEGHVAVVLTGKAEGLPDSAMLVWLERHDALHFARELFAACMRAGQELEDSDANG